MHSRKPEFLAYILLIGLSLIYCHRFLGTYCIETDLVANISYRLNEAQMRLDYNPYQWDYSSWMPFIGLENPVIAGMSWFAKAMFPKMSEVGRSYFINFLSSWFLLSLFASSVYAFFRYCGRSIAGALVGSILVAFTGFQLTGVRLFNHMYLLSFSAVCPVWYCFIQISQKQRVGRHVLLAGLCIGISLLGGSNTPLFYYLPCFFLIPVLNYLAHREGRKIAQVWESVKWMLLAGVCALVIGAATIFPGVYFLNDTNRSSLQFIDHQYVLGFMDQVRSLFFRDWWWKRPSGYYESDCYFGMAGLFLVTVGLFHRFRNKEKGPNGVEAISLLCIAVALIVLNLHQFPPVIVGHLSRFFEVLSIRNSSRFFMLALVPLGYWAAKGFDLSEKKFVGRIGLSVVALTGLLFSLFIGPNWQGMAPTMKIACLSSLVFSIVAIGIILLRFWRKEWRLRLNGVAVALLFLSALFAPIPRTNYGGTLGEGVITKSEFTRFFNFRGAYAEIVAAMENYLLHPPKLLQAKESYRGRIWDPMEEAVLRINYFATRTHHRMAFSSVSDMASSRRLREYFMGRTDAMMDLYQVCTEVKRNGAKAYLSVRKTCLPEAFLVSHVNSFERDSEILGWLQTKNREDFLTEAAIRCPNRTSCRNLPADLMADEGPKVKGSIVKKLGKGMQSFSLQVSPKLASLLFLSIPYHRGWVAEVDGVGTEVFRVNHAFMGIPVSAGAKQVNLRFDNVVVTYSRAMTRYSILGAVLLLCYLTWQEKNLSSIFRRRKREPSPLRV